MTRKAKTPTSLPTIERQVCVLKRGEWSRGMPFVRVKLLEQRAQPVHDLPMKFVRLAPAPDGETATMTIPYWLARDRGMTREGALT